MCKYKDFCINSDNYSLLYKFYQLLNFPFYEADLNLKIPNRKPAMKMPSLYGLTAAGLGSGAGSDRPININLISNLQLYGKKIKQSL